MTPVSGSTPSMPSKDKEGKKLKKEKVNDKSILTSSAIFQQQDKENKENKPKKEIHGKLTKTTKILSETEIAETIAKTKISTKNPTKRQMEQRDKFYETKVEKKKAFFEDDYGDDFDEIKKNIPPPLYDENRLIAGRKSMQTESESLEASHFGWHLNLAMASLPDIESLDEETKKKIEFIKLQAWRKVAPQETELGFQMSPVFQEQYDYHRSGHSELHKNLNDAYASSLSYYSSNKEVFVIDSPLIREVIAREMPHPELEPDINSTDQFGKLIDTLFKQVAVYSIPSPPNDWIFIDVSKLIPSSDDVNLKKEFKKFAKIFNDKLEEFKKNNPSQLVEINNLIAKLQLIACIEHKGQNVLVVPKDSFNQAKKTDQKIDPHNTVDFYIDRLMIRSGFRVNPSQAITALLNIYPSAEDFLRRYQYIVEARLATGSEKRLAARLDQKHEFGKAGETIPEVCKNWNEFINLPVVKKFKGLSDDKSAPPYLKILPAATVQLLEGFNKVDEKIGGINKYFEDRNIQDFLQTSYYLTLRAMQEAILRKDDFVFFNNCIEFIHQQIQNILVVVAPYKENALSEAITASLTSGQNPVIPKELEPSGIHLKASAMHSLSSILAGIEAEKGTNKLNVAVQKDSYYESVDSLEKAKTYKLFELDGDVLNQNPAEALKNLKNPPIDLFLCEFHHNISITRQSYVPENVAKQIKALVDSGMTAKKLTVVIDSTINLQQSDDIRNLLADETIKNLVKEGKLNVVLLRSAQKYDMLGMDNYYGGITTTINNKTSFGQFNTRMDDKNDQLKDLNYQGITHLLTHAADSLDKDRAAKMNAAQMLYSQLPEKMIYKEGTANPVQISEIKDDKLVFLDIKFSKNLATSLAFIKRFRQFAQENELPLSMRSSFGFATTNLTILVVDKDEPPKVRINPGLDDEKTLSKYAKFFHVIQTEIDKATKEIDQKEPKLFDQLLADRIKNLVI